MWRRTLCLATVSSLALLAACGGSSGGKATGGSAEKSVTIRIATPNAKGDPNSNAAEEFKKTVEAATNGRVKVNVFYGGQLGAIDATQQQVSSGALQMLIADVDYIGKFLPATQVLDMPFVWPGPEQAKELFDGSLGASVKAAVQAKTNMMILGFTTFGMGQIDNKKRDINSAEDLKGLKLRVLPSDVAVQSYQATGIVPVNIDFSEAFQGIQTGTIDGVVLPFSTTVSSKIYEVAPHIGVVNAQQFIGSIEVNKAFFQKLSAADQKLVSTAAADAAAHVWTNVGGTVTANQQTLTEKKAKITTLPAEQIAQIRKDVQPIWTKFAQTYGSDGVEWLNQIEQATS
jgi:tripartite ATP-independent transporter DctP family solute receptor